MSKEELEKFKRTNYSFDKERLFNFNSLANKKRTVSTAKSNKLSIEFVNKLIEFIKANIPESRCSHLIIAIGETFNKSGFNDAAIKLFFEFINTAPKESKYKSLYAYALLTLGRIYSDKEYWIRSDSYIRKALRRFIKLKDKSGQIKCYNLLAINQAETGKLPKSIINFEKCLYLTKDRELLLRAKIEMNMGAIYLFQHNFNLSLYYSLLALSKFEKYNDFNNIVKLRYNIGNNYYEMNLLQYALKEYDKSIALSQKLGLILNIGRVYHNKALVYVKANDIEMAIAYWKKALEVFEKINDPTLKYLLLQLRGIISIKQKKFNDAKKYLEASKEQLLKYNNKMWIADNEFILGRLYKEWGKKELALTSFYKANNTYKNMNLIYHVSKTLSEINNIK